MAVGIDGNAIARRALQPPRGNGLTEMVRTMKSRPRIRILSAALPTQMHGLRVARVGSPRRKTDAEIIIIASGADGFGTSRQS